MIVDSHCHLDDPRFSEDLDAVLARAQEQAVEQMLTVGCWGSHAERERAVSLAEAHANVFASVGVHPHDVATMEEGSFEHVRSLAEHPDVVALGETGLDYHYDHSPRALQQECFARFVELAAELKMPLIVHSRSADEDTDQILRSSGGGSIEGVVHCFTSTPALAESVLGLGWHIGITGIVTFRQATNVVEVVKMTPLERLLVETDAPYLAPIPFRGKRNEPSFLPQTVAKIAEIKGVSAEQVARVTAENARRLFSLPTPIAEG